MRTRKTAFIYSWLIAATSSSCEIVADRPIVDADSSIGNHDSGVADHDAVADSADQPSHQDGGDGGRIGDDAEGSTENDSMPEGRQGDEKSFVSDAGSEGGGDSSVEAGTSSSGDACTDSDVQDCSDCTHDCLGGACIAGQCQPVLLAQYVGNPGIIFVGSQAIYATTDSGYIGRANKDGTDLGPFAKPGFASSVFSGTLVGEDGDRVFFVRSGDSSPIQLSYCTSSACDSTAMAIGGPYTQYFALDTVNHKVAWIDYSPSQLWAAPSVGTVSGMPVSGGALAAGSSGSRLFYSQGGIFFTDGAVLKRIPAAGGAITGVTAGNAALTILGANSTRLFLFDGTNIVYVPLPNGDGGPPKPVMAASLQPNVDGRFAADDGSMYWVSDGAIETCQIDTCAATLRVLPTRTVDRAADVGADDRAIYWIAASPGPSMGLVGCTVWKLAK